MFRMTRRHRWFAAGFLLAWALSHRAIAQGDTREAKPSSSDLIRQKLDQVIVLDYAGQSVTEAMAHLKDRTQLPIVVDQVGLQSIGLMDGIPINVELRNARGKVRHALQHLLHGLGLNYVILEDCLLITTEESAMIRQMRQRVPVDVREVAAGKALRDLARQAGVSLAIDPRVSQAASQKVTLELEEATVETALRIVSEFVDLKAVRMGNVIFVTDPVRAEKIRKEESQQAPMDSRVLPAIDRIAGGMVGPAGNAIIPVPPVPPAPPEVRKDGNP